MTKNLTDVINALPTERQAHVHLRSNEIAMTELYRQNPQLAIDLINDILKDPDGDQGELLVVLRQVAKAYGGVPLLAEQTKLNPTQLYRTLSKGGNPGLNNLSAILKVLGMRLAVLPLNNSQRVA